MLKTYLDDLENRIDSEVEDNLIDQWGSFWNGGFTGDIFTAKRQRAIPSTLDWPEVTINQALEDYEKMFIQQLKGCSDAIALGAGSIMNVRCNYGTSIMPSLFGAEIYIMDKELNCLPTSIPMGSEAAIALIDRGVPALETGQGKQVIEMTRIFAEEFAKYPKINKYVDIYHPDLQGPMDVCELIWGCDLFLNLVDQPEQVKQLLDLITDTYIALMKELNKIVPPAPGAYSSHWGIWQKGKIMLRDDSAMNLSPEMFAEFIRPYDQRLLNTFGGGGIHFCGRGSHYIKLLSEMDNVTNVPMSQPEYNDMEEIYRNTIDKGIKLISFSRETAEAALASGRNLHSNVHCA